MASGLPRTTNGGCVKVTKSTTSPPAVSPDEAEGGVEAEGTATDLDGADGAVEAE